MMMHILRLHIVVMPERPLTFHIDAFIAQKLPIPRPFMRVALSMMRRSVRKRASFSIDEVAPLDFVGETFVPALFGEPNREPLGILEVSL